jgi:hypothetical protein
MTDAPEISYEGESTCSFPDKSPEIDGKSHIMQLDTGTVRSLSTINLHDESREKHAILYPTGARKMVPAKRKAKNPSLSSDGVARNSSNGRKTVEGYLGRVNGANGSTRTAYITTMVDQQPSGHAEGIDSTPCPEPKKCRKVTKNSHAAGVGPNKSPLENTTSSRPSINKTEDLPNKESTRIKDKNDPWYTPRGVVWEMLDDVTDMTTEWVSPTMCKESYVTYAEDGVWRTTMEKAGFVRNVKGVKQGEFDEDEVVFATRYFVC